MARRWRHINAALCTLALCLAALPAGAADLVETAQKTKQTGRFKIDHFGVALEVAGLVDSQKPGSFTIFAPTNQVFRRVDLGVMKPGGPAMSPEGKLRAADQDRLADVLKHHVVEGSIPYSELAAMESVQTLAGSTLEITRTEGGILLNDDITIAQPDLMADNGVIHVVEGLLAGGPQR